MSDLEESGRQRDDIKNDSTGNDSNLAQTDAIMRMAMPVLKGEMARFTLIADTRLNITDDRGGNCRLRVWKDDSDSGVVMMTSDRIGGFAIQNQSENIASTAANIYKLDPRKVTFIEHWQIDGHIHEKWKTDNETEQFSIVTYKQVNGTRVDYPIWKETDRATVEQLVGPLNAFVDSGPHHIPNLPNGGVDSVALIFGSHLQYYAAQDSDCDVLVVSQAFGSLMEIESYRDIVTTRQSDVEYNRRLQEWSEKVLKNFGGSEGLEKMKDAVYEEVVKTNPWLERHRVDIHVTISEDDSPFSYLRAIRLAALEPSLALTEKNNADEGKGNHGESSHLQTIIGFDRQSRFVIQREMLKKILIERMERGLSEE